MKYKIQTFLAAVLLIGTAYLFYVEKQPNENDNALLEIMATKGK